MSNEQVKEAFELSAKFIAHQSYQSLTHAFIHFFSSLDNVNEVSSYEIFGNVSVKNDLSIRRFPLTLSEDFRDNKTDVLLKFLAESKGGIYQDTVNDKHWIFLDVIHGVKPRRAILIEGALSSQELVTLEGLYGVYANQVALLDSKERDALTELSNRQTLQTTLNDIVVYYRNKPDQIKEKSSWLAVLDIDHFKKINDDYGHLFGDEVLVHFSRLMENTFRHTDFIFRYGGEEFVVILNNNNLEGARKSLERFRAAVENYNFPSGKVTVSTGFSMIDPVAPPSLHIEYADQAVYEAKNRGRNNVVYHGDMKAQLRHESNDIEMF